MRIRICRFYYRAPTVYSVAMATVTRDGEQLKQNKTNATAGALAKLGNIYNIHLNAYGKLNGLLLRASGCNKRTINKLSVLYDSVSYTCLTNMMDSYANEAKSYLPKLASETVIHIGDNVDVRSQVRHESSGNSFHDVHMYNSMMVKARACVDALSDTPQKPPAEEEVNFSEFLIGEEEQRMITLAGGRCICSSWSHHVDGVNVEVDHRPQKHTDAMKKKSEKVFNCCQ